MDQFLLDKICSYFEKHPLFFSVVKKINILSKGFYIIIYTIVLLYLLFNKNIILFYYFTIPALAYILNTILRHTIKRQRPESAIKKSSYSFPSNHSMSASVISLCTFYVYKPLGIVLLILSLITAFCRLPEKIHYPSDVIAGLSLGYFIAFRGYFIFLSAF